MAHYDVVWSCGHIEDKQLYGKMDTRESYLAWASRSGTCSACAANDAAAKVAAIEVEHGLAPLTGSAKQIAWARKIRAELLGKVQEYLARVQTKVTPGKEALFAEHRDALFVALASKDQSRWWIDYRDITVNELIARATKA